MTGIYYGGIGTWKFWGKGWRLSGMQMEKSEFRPAITGLVWSFDWWTNGIYRILGADVETYMVYSPFRLFLKELFTLEQREFV